MPQKKTPRSKLNALWGGKSPEVDKDISWIVQRVSEVFPPPVPK
jgi:hypothetical protein